MFEQVFENLQKATESSMKMQQEMFQKWVEGFPKATSAMPSTPDVFGDWRKQWEESAVHILKRQKELVDENYEAGIKALNDIFAVSESKNPQEYQQKVMELYQKSFESIRQLSESQLAEFKAAAEKCSKSMTTPTT